MMRTLKSAPALQPLKPYVWALRSALRSARSTFGKYPRTCTVCNHTGRFFAYGYPLRADVICPKCLSFERHRSLVLCDREQSLFAGKDILHFAPEQSIRGYIQQQLPKSYITADLFAAGVDLKLNVERIDLPDNAFDLVLCSHVLEHVNDAVAIPELYRITRPGGTLIAMFPIVDGWDRSFEDPTKITEEERLLYFGQHDHVRFYGRDARERLAAPGFTVEEWTAVEPAVSKHGLQRGEKIFLCRKT